MTTGYKEIGTEQISLEEAAAHIVESSIDRDLKILEYLKYLTPLIYEVVKDRNDSQKKADDFVGYLFLKGVDITRDYWPVLRVEGDENSERLRGKEAEFVSAQRELNKRFGLQLKDWDQLQSLSDQVGVEIRHLLNS